MGSKSKAETSPNMCPKMVDITSRNDLRRNEGTKPKAALKQSKKKHPSCYHHQNSYVTIEDRKLRAIIIDEAVNPNWNNFPTIKNRTLTNQFAIRLLLFIVMTN